MVHGTKKLGNAALDEQPVDWKFILP